MPVATHADRYGLVLVALFIIASGMTVLQVAANPLSAALGRPGAISLPAGIVAGFQFHGTS